MAGENGKNKDDRDAFAVLVEDLRSQFKVFGEALQSLDEKVDRGFDAVGRRFDAVDRRFDAVDQRFDAVDQRFEGVDQRFEGVYARLDRTDGELVLVKAAVLENSREIRELRGTVTRIELAVDKKVDRDEVEAVVARAIAR